MRFVFYLSRIVFAAAGGVNTDFHGWGCEIYDGFPRICGGGGARSRILRMIISHRSHRFHRFFYLTDCGLRSRILRMIISHGSRGFRGFFYLTDFAVFLPRWGYRSQISQISRIFLSHRLLTCPGYSLRNSKLKTNVLWRLQSVLSVKSV